MPENNESELRSHEVQEILAIVPHWTIRWGNFIILLITAIALYFSWLIKYPEIDKYSMDIVSRQDTLSVGKSYKSMLKNKDFIIAKLKIGDQNFSRIGKGQQVILHLNNYSGKEFGTIKGTIIHVYFPHENDPLLVAILFPEGFRTSYGKEILFYPGIQGNIDIIIGNPRLLQKIFYRFRNVF